ncbi:TPA: hypothetical protein DCL30_03300 [Candidatus Peribacteria bacterium]|nr:MAG: hypothetical protein A2529_05405 [Candidatus Peribacteria bacterium RIFOXYD2_FULL_58_15]OGJ83885.1 MAG: hypothetical protein A3J91_02785 [Candidatus Peribacteria bacterium RIFOXYC2_FULL_58_10]HAI98541.1 hypothetical protein [Candidatus Peribacteria bacterium]HAS34254.1 hypothetical protein [Candidatus Peribacteria bacterium]
MPKVLILTGPGGAGKTTIGKILEAKHGYVYLDGDREDTKYFPNGDQWLPENADLLRKAHMRILMKAKKLVDKGKNVVVDYIIFGRYLEFFTLFKEQFGNHLQMKVLMPSQEELIRRDRERECWTTGEERIATVYEEFMSLRGAIGAQNFIDSSMQTPEETVAAILS